MAVEGAVAPEDRELRALLGEARTIAVVGLSSKTNRPSNEVATFLKERGYAIVPVNPKEPGVTVMSYPDFRDYYIARSIRNAAVFVSRNVTLAADADPVRLEAIAVTGQFFNVLGVRPTLGRSIVNEDANPESPPVVVLSHALWIEQYGGDPTAIGRRVRLNGRQYEIIGVMPRQFSFPERSRLWVPFKPTSYDLSDNGRGNDSRRVFHSAVQTQRRSRPPEACERRDVAPADTPFGARHEVRVVVGLPVERGAVVEAEQ